jgi:hypothetical protein
MWRPKRRDCACSARSTICRIDSNPSPKATTPAGAIFEASFVWVLQLTRRRDLHRDRLSQWLDVFSGSAVLFIGDANLGPVLTERNE